MKTAVVSQKYHCWGPFDDANAAMAWAVEFGRGLHSAHLPLLVVPIRDRDDPHGVAATVDPINRGDE
jgi:hypothetical protein